VDDFLKGFEAQWCESLVKIMFMKNSILFFTSFTTTVLVFSFMYLPVTVSIILYIALLFSKEKLLISYSINFTGILVILFLYLASGEIINKQFNSPHQKLIIDPSFNFLNYPPNRTLLNQVVSKGDLTLFDNLSAEYSSDRKIDFITDNLGFRNSNFFSSGDIIVIGDSYVVGNGGVNQDDTVSSKLEKFTGKGVYNLGFPGDPFNYYHRLLKYDELINKSDGIVFFIFEGNDLNCHSSATNTSFKANSFKNKLLNFTAYRVTIFDNTSLYKIGFGLYHRVYGVIFDNEQKTYRSIINGKKTAFLKNYVDILYDEEVCPKRLQEFSAIYDKYSRHIKMVVYIPTKGHIYFESLRNKKPSNIKIKVMHELAKRYSIDFLDLTEHFQQNKDKEILYFSDDSHWNSFGIDLAAKLISARLKNQ
jgi:hypothetical protein